MSPRAAPVLIAELGKEGFQSICVPGNVADYVVALVGRLGILRSPVYRRSSTQTSDCDVYVREEMTMSEIVYIEHEGALFRGASRSHPQEVWSHQDQKWRPYTFDAPWKPIEWGTEISEEEFEQRVVDL